MRGTRRAPTRHGLPTKCHLRSTDAHDGSTPKGEMLTQAASPSQLPDHRAFFGVHALSNAITSLSVRVAISTVSKNVGHVPSSGGCFFCCRNASSSDWGHQELLDGLGARPLRLAPRAQHTNNRRTDQEIDALVGAAPFTSQPSSRLSATDDHIQHCLGEARRPHHIAKMRSRPCQSSGRSSFKSLPGEYATQMSPSTG